MAETPSPTETVNQGHNILALGFSQTQTQANLKQVSTTRFIFRSGTRENNESYIARTEGTATPAGAPGHGITAGNLTPGPIIWQTPKQLAKIRSGKIDYETIAYVIAENEDQFLFNQVKNRVYIRSKLASDEEWSISTEATGLGNLELAHRSIVAVWIGGTAQTILLYAWTRQYGLVECVGTRLTGKSYTFVANTKETIIADGPGCKRLGLVNTTKGLYLVSIQGTVKQEVLVWRNKPIGGKWGAAVTLNDKNGKPLSVHGYSPSTIIDIPAEKAAEHAADLIPQDVQPTPVPCYPIPEYIPPLPTVTPFLKDREAELAVAFVDKDFTVQIQRFTYTGAPLGDLARVSRLNPPSINNQRTIRALALTRGRHPRARSVYGISRLHDTKTLLSLDEEADLDRYTYAAATREAFHQALKQVNWLLKLANTSAAELIAAQKLVREQFDGVVHVKNVQSRDYWELKYLLARSRWQEAFFAAREAQNRAIAAYNALIEADLQVKVNPVKTEAHKLVNGCPELPLNPNLPAE